VKASGRQGAGRGRCGARAKPDAVDAESRVFAGTINGGGAIEIEVTPFQ
jgi:hypothetical protein